MKRTDPFRYDGRMTNHRLRGSEWRDHRDSAQPGHGRAFTEPRRGVATAFRGSLARRVERIR